jgi:hypothetical protein
MVLLFSDFAGTGSAIFQASAIFPFSTLKIFTLANTFRWELRLLHTATPYRHQQLYALYRFLFSQYLDSLKMDAMHFLTILCHPL